MDVFVVGGRWSEDDQACDAGENNDQYGMNAGEIDDTERCHADGDGNQPLAHEVSKVLAVHQQ